MEPAPELVPQPAPERVLELASRPELAAQPKLAWQQVLASEQKLTSAQKLALEPKLASQRAQTPAQDLAQAPVQRPVPERELAQQAPVRLALALDSLLYRVFS